MRTRTILAGWIALLGALTVAVAVGLEGGAPAEAPAVPALPLGPGEVLASDPGLDGPSAPAPAPGGGRRRAG
jgi:hypothetical protein